MKKARIFVAAFATVLAASFAVAGGDTCDANKNVAKGEKTGCCKSGAQVAKGGAEDAGKAAGTCDASAKAGDCASKCEGGAQVAKGGADDAGKAAGTCDASAKAGDCASKCEGGAQVAKGGADDAGKKGECASECSGKCGAEVAKGGAEDAGKGIAEGYGLGQKPSAIELPDAVTGANAPLVDGNSAATVVIFWNQGCPYVVEAQDRVAAYAKEAAAKNVRVVAVDANDPALANSAEKLKEYASTRPFPVLVNADSTVALKFGATRTPEAFVFDKAGVIQYHGAFDGGQKDPKKTYVADAVNALLEGKTPEVTTTRAFGCTIKYGESAKAAMKAAVSEAKAEVQGTEMQAKRSGVDRRELKKKLAAEEMEAAKKAEAAAKGSK